MAGEQAYSWLNSLLAEEPGYDYGNVLPVRRNTSTGALGPAMPGMARSYLQGLAELVNASGQAAQGNAVPVSQNALMSAPLGGAGMAAAMRPNPNMLGMFLGRNAVTADREALAKAFTMESRGAHPEDIFDSTGWFKDVDGSWKFEINDKKGTMQTGPGSALEENPYTKGLYGVPMFPKNKLTVKDAIDHPDLFNAYPELRNLSLSTTPFGAFGLKGAYGTTKAGNKLLQLSSANLPSMKNTLLHELQHAVQDIEGFAGGGSPSEFRPPGFSAMEKTHNTEWSALRDAAEKVGVEPYKIQGALTSHRKGALEAQPGHYYGSTIEALKKNGLLDKAMELNDERSAIEKIRTESHQKYSNLAGETEARNVERRHALDGDSATQPYPWITRQQETPDSLIWGTERKGNPK